MFKPDESRKESQESFKKRGRLGSNATASDKNIRVQELHEILIEEKQRNNELENRFEEIHKEMALKSIEMEQRIIKLKETLKKVRNGYVKTQNPIKELEIVDDVNSKLQGSIKEILKEASELVSVKENEIIKSFDFKLSEICAELEDKRKKKNKEIAANKEKEEQYTAEAEMLKKSANYIESRNKNLEEHNKQLKVELNARESELLALKKRILTMTTPLQIRPESQSPFTRIRNPLTAHSLASRSSSSDSRSQRYDTIVLKLKQLIEIERSNLRAAKTAFTAEMEYKTEIEKILRSCVDDVKMEILKKKGQIRKIELDGEKKVILDELLAAEDFLNRVYDRAYPKSLLKR
ncbi:hypothetical protein SteCoe_37285 [Stentor coeruleus]|uniref:Uncharacterized protein n=1 Tax=Stentor coeruleus TaxID=5963 RepID=A0A1R2ANB8_9CILI|nr:hypothetical protein SteCoe_37285 [Stentor coeruleus]